MADRVQKASSAAEFVPSGRLSLTKLRKAAADCRGCELWKRGTQTVFGEGARGARVILVGEQPGDAEDLAGRPFVGPAGGLLDRALERAGLVREELYVTNAVKHFKWVLRGKRRIHQKPRATELGACRPWLESEVAVIGPEVIVAMGATAAQSLLGSQFKITKQRGRFFDATEWAPATLTATVHPSSILRVPDREARQAAFEALVADLRKVHERLAS
jgi:uracil-DNA glycosylase family protein